MNSDAAVGGGGAADAFSAGYEPLRAGRPQLGEACLLPLDSRIFRFGVADYRVAPIDAGPPSPEELRAELTGWARRHGVELIGCRVPASHVGRVEALQEAGFRFVELQLRATLPRLRAEALRPSRLTVRPGAPADTERIREIANSAFDFGRYHADARFPRALADLRYREWVGRALAEPSAGTRMIVVGPPERASGFLHAEVEGGRADIRLAAVAREQGGIAGPELFRGALRLLAEEGTGQATARVSAGNTPVLNVYAALGFRFHDPDIVLHWHAPESRHLEPLEGRPADPGAR